MRLLVALLVSVELGCRFGATLATDPPERPGSYEVNTWKLYQLSSLRRYVYRPSHLPGRSLRRHSLLSSLCGP